jgi:hypothetical protein
VWAEQAIFTSLPRRGREGYHLVSRSPGVGDAVARALASWAPSHGALIVDRNNRISVNFHQVPGGRFALSRTCAGPAEYSGRGGHQLYTHSLIFDGTTLEAVGFQPFALYRDALSMGCLLYQPDPVEALDPISLSRLHPRRDAGYWAGLAAELGLPALSPLREQLISGQPLRFAYAGERTVLAECLIGMLSPESVRCTSFSTSLFPSAARPFVLLLVAAG